MTQQQQLCLRVCSDFDYKQLEFFVLRQMRENFRNDQRVRVFKYYDFTIASQLLKRLFAK